MPVSDQETRQNEKRCQKQLVTGGKHRKNKAQKLNQKKRRTHSHARGRIAAISYVRSSRTVGNDVCHIRKGRILVPMQRLRQRARNITRNNLLGKNREYRHESPVRQNG